MAQLVRRGNAVVLAFLLVTTALVSAGLTQSPAPNLVVHEWGTFTSVAGHDGRAVEWQPLSGPSDLPCFVRVLNPVCSKCVTPTSVLPTLRATVRMETPVLYFYSEQARTVKVDVGFRGGSISQWYPERSGGESSPRMPLPHEFRAVLPIDFSNGFNGSAAWKVNVLKPGTSDAFSARRDSETPQWPRARVADANRVRGSKGEVEGFIFYRGLGNFALPLKVKAAA